MARISINAEKKTQTRLQNILSVKSRINYIEKRKKNRINLKGLSPLSFVLVISLMSFMNSSLFILCLSSLLFWPFYVFVSFSFFSSSFIIFYFFYYYSPISFVYYFFLLTASLAVFPSNLSVFPSLSILSCNIAFSLLLSSLFIFPFTAFLYSLQILSLSFLIDFKVAILGKDTEKQIDQIVNLFSIISFQYN